MEISNNQFMERKLEENLRRNFGEIADIIAMFATGRAKPGQDRRSLKLDLSILSIEFISGLKLQGRESFESASLLDYAIQLSGEESSVENLQELVRCYGLLVGLEERLFSDTNLAFVYA